MRCSVIYQQMWIGCLWLLALVAQGVSAAPTIHSAEVLENSNNEYCNYCHLDLTLFNPVRIWHGEDQGVLCLSCHNPTGLASAKSEVALHRVNNGALIVDCSSCHNPHGTDVVYRPDSLTWSNDPHPGGVLAPNLDHIRAKTTKYLRDVQGIQRLEPTVFQRRPDHYAFGDAEAPWNGICQTCHQNTVHHTNNANGDHTHNAGLVCTGCHPHKEGFLPRGAGDCAYCHNVPRGDNGDGTFRRRQIFDAGGDFMKSSHHVKSNIQVSDCATCHYLKDHSRGVVKLQDQDDPNVHYDYNPSDPSSVEPFCLSCHDSDGSLIGGGTRPFSDGVTVPVVKDASGGEWANSAHKSRGYANNGGSPLTCLGDGTGGGCHANGHASDNEKLLSLASGQTINQLCFNCHTDGGVLNDAISGPGLASSIQSAFNLTDVHNLETTFKGGSYNYALQCTTCHNPHVVTGKYTDAATGHSPVTRPDFSRSPADNPRAMGSTLWGAAAGQKAQDYATTATPHTGTYRTPNGEAFDGTELPDYNSLCLDCHGVGAMPAPSATNPNDRGGIDWVADRHGLNAAIQPWRYDPVSAIPYGAPPDWFSAGLAEGWNGDDCIALETECWPVIPLGKGDQVWTKPPFEHVERIAGANFVLQCVNCHEAHGSNNRSMLRTDPNGGAGSTDWRTMCTNCHFIDSNWHENVSCGSNSCHLTSRMINAGRDTLHNIDVFSTNPDVRIFDPTLVADLRFEDDLNDSGSWYMHGRWFDLADRYSTIGFFAPGYSGNGVALNGNQPIELGTRNLDSSLDEALHGTWKLTEMKYHTTLEAWISPGSSADSEQVIFTKSVPYSEGGYRLSLLKRDQGWVLAFYINVDGTANGVRGAYSSVPVALNQWSHVAASFDTDGPDRNGGDPSVGRIRIYVNGEDVTTSDASGALTQPAAGETHIFPYSDHSPANESVCSNGWCASAFSVGSTLGPSGSRHGFVGLLDEAKVWNITQPASYFQSIDATAAPRILGVTGAVGSTQLAVIFSEGIYGSGGGALQVADFSYTDADDGRTVIAVNHVAGSNTATLTLSSPLDVSYDVGVDILQVVGVDEYGNGAENNTLPVAIVAVCPSGQTVFDFNEPAGSASLLDVAGVISGSVNNEAAALLGDGTLHGDGLNNYVTFDNNISCLKATRAMTVEVRIRPTGIADTYYESTILSRDTGGANYRLSLWRGDQTLIPGFVPPPGVAAVVLWVKPADAHGGNAWKPVLTSVNSCPLYGDRWYKIKTVWNSDKLGGVPDQPHVMADIFIDDQGSDGLDTDGYWPGYVNCTDYTQSYLSGGNLSFTGDEISVADGVFSIGVDVNDHAVGLFNGQIDWLKWEGVADYSGLDAPPY